MLEGAARGVAWSAEGALASHCKSVVKTWDIRSAQGSEDTYLFDSDDGSIDYNQSNARELLVCAANGTAAWTCTAGSCTMMTLLVDSVPTRGQYLSDSHIVGVGNDGSLGFWSRVASSNAWERDEAIRPSVGVAAGVALQPLRRAAFRCVSWSESAHVHVWHFGSGRDSLEDADGSGDDDDDDYYDYKIENDAVGGMIGGASMKNVFGGLKGDLVAVLGASTLLASDSDADAQKTLRQEVVELRRDIEDGRLRGV